MNLSERSWHLIFAGYFLFYIIIRLWNLTDSCLWFDEIFSVHAAEHSWLSMFWFVAQDLIHPPFFYFLLKIWIQIGGESVLWLRLFPVLFSTAALIPFYLLCKQLKLKQSALVFALTFFAVNGSLIKYAQEVRMYSVLLCLSLFSIWIFARFLHNRNSFWLLTVINILLIYTHYFGFFVVFAEIVTVIFLQKSKIRQILKMFGIILLSFIPWLWILFQAAHINVNVSQNLGWANKPGLFTVLLFIFNLNEPYYYQLSNVSAVSIWAISLPILLVIGIVLGLYSADFPAQEEEQKNAFYFLIIFILTPVVVAFTASWLLPFSVWGTRHFIIIFAPYSIILGLAFSTIKQKTVKIILQVLFIIFVLFAFVLNALRGNEPQIWCGWENFASELKQQNFQNKTIIYVFEDLIAYQFWFALRSDENFQIIKVNKIPEIMEDKAYFLPRGFDAVLKIEANQINENKFFIAFRANEFDYTKQPLLLFSEKGFRINEINSFEASGQKAFLVLMEK